MTAQTTATSSTLIYGKDYYIQNGYSNRGGGYLDTRSSGCNGNFLCVSTATTSNRDNGSGTWKILSASGKQNGTPVSINDEIYLQNLYPSRSDVLGGYLDTRSAGCNGNLLCVSTSATKERDSNSTHWHFISTEPASATINDQGTISTEAGKTYKVQVTIDIPADVGYKNSFGIFAINDDGSVAGVKPGATNYAETVVKNRIPLADADKGSYQKGQTFKYDLPGGPKYGVFLIANSTPEQFLQNNPTNQGSKPPLAYFFDTAANPDQKSHIKVLSPNQYGFEDTHGGGDQDFNDLIVKIETISVS